MNLRACLCVSLLVASSATAQQFQPGKGCEGFLTVQMKGCYVTNFWTCDEAPEGYIYRASHDGSGALVAGAFDAERNWVDTLFNDGWRERLVHPATDPISISDLLETGTDTYDFETLTNSGSADLEVIRTRIRGMDVLTGQTENIDGVELLELFYLLTYTDSAGTLYSKGWGQQFFSPEFRVFVSGKDFWDDGSTVEEYDNTPVKFMVPGDEGFGSITPEFDCGGGMPVAEGDEASPPDEGIFSLPPAGEDGTLLPPAEGDGGDGLPKKSDEGAKTK